MSEQASNNLLVNILWVRTPAKDSPIPGILNTWSQDSSKRAPCPEVRKN